VQPSIRRKSPSSVRFVVGNVVAAVVGIFFARQVVSQSSSSEYDVVCQELSVKFGQCACQENPTTTLGVVGTAAFVSCFTPELRVNANFTGNLKYLSSLQFCVEEGVNDETCTTFYYDDLDSSQEILPSSCEVRAVDVDAGNSYDCASCALCETPIDPLTNATSYGVDVDCNNLGSESRGAAEIISTNGTCHALVDRFQYQYVREADIGGGGGGGGETSGSVRVGASHQRFGFSSVGSFATAAAAIATATLSSLLLFLPA